MKLYRAHDGLSLSLPAPPAATSTLDDLLDCLSLATGIATDNIICMTADGAQLHPDNYRSLLSLDPAGGAATPNSTAPDAHTTDLEFFIYNREYLYAEPNALAQQLALPTHLEPPLQHIDELPEPGTPNYVAAILPWTQQALSLIRTHASRAHLAHAALSNMHRASAIALANLLQYTRTIAAGAEALDSSVGAELTRMKDLLEGYERDLRIIGMVPIDPRLLNPSSKDTTAGGGGGAGAAGAPSSISRQNSAASTQSAQHTQANSSSPASTPSSQGHGLPSTTPPPTKRLGDYVSRQRMSAVAAACSRVHTELASRFVNLHNHLNALQTDVGALESEVRSVDLGPALDNAEAAREARQRAEEVVERGLVPWLSGALSSDPGEHQHVIEQGLLPAFPLASGDDTNALKAEHDQDRLHNQLEEALTELVLLDEVTRSSVIRLSQDRNDMQARIITFLQDISAVQSDLGELAEAMDVIEREEMPPGATVRQAVKTQQLSQAQNRALAQAKAQQAQTHSPTSAAQHYSMHQNALKAASAATIQPASVLASAVHAGFVIDGFRPNIAPIAAAAAGAGTGIGAAPPPNSSTTSSNNAGSAQQQQIRTDGFRHLARLHHMLLAYGAALVELVRRATYNRLFIKSAQGVAELMALVNEREVERRKEFRKAGVGSILPWDVRALSMVPLTGSGGGANFLGGASVFGDEGTPTLEINSKGMISLHAVSGGASSGVDPVAAALASAAELGREDIDKLFALLDDIERALEQEAELARESQATIAARRRSSLLRQQSATGGFALPQGQRSPATPPHLGSVLQSPTGATLTLLPVNPIPEVRAALMLLVEEIDEMEPEFKDLVNVTLLERRSRFRRRRGSRRTRNGMYGDSTTGPGDNDDQSSDGDDDDSDDETDADIGSVLNGGGNRGARSSRPRTSRRSLRKQIKELTARIGEADATISSTRATLEAAQTENARLRSDLAHLTEEHHTSHAAIRQELESVRADSRSNAEAYDRARHARDDALAQLEALRNDVDTETARRLNLEEEVTNVRKDLKEARKEEASARHETLELEERLAELEIQTSEMQHELENAVRAREDVNNRIEGLLKEGSSVERELASAQSRIEELNREASAARTEVREAKEALAEAENARDKLIRTYRAEADGDRAILEENVRSKEHELRLAKEGLKNAETARKAAEAREAAERTVSDGLRGQLEAAHLAHEAMLRDLEEAKEESLRLEGRLRDTTDERDELLRLGRPLLARVQALRKIVKAMPILSSSKNGTNASAVGDKDGTPHERQNSAASAGSDVTPVVSGAHPASVGNARPNGLLNAAMEAFENEGETSAALSTTLGALRALDPRIFHDEVKAKLESLTTLVRKWQKAYKGHQEKTSRAQASARDRIAYRNFQVGDLVLFLPTRNTTERTFAAFNRGYPHYFLRAEGAFKEQVRSKDYLLDRITGITEKVAGSAAAMDGGGDADGTNPYQLAEGVRYHILDVEGATGPIPVSATSAPQTPSRPGLGAPRSVSHDSRATRRRDSSVTTSSIASVASPPSATGPAPISVTAPSGLTLSRSTSRSFDRVGAALGSSAMTSSSGTANAGTASTATIKPLSTFGGASGTANNNGLSPIETSISGSAPTPAFGSRSRRRAANSSGEAQNNLGSTSVSPSSGTTSAGGAITPAVPLPISMPRNGQNGSSELGPTSHHRSSYDRSTAISRGGSNGAEGGQVGGLPTAAELERGLKDPSTSRAIAEALAAEGLHNIGNPFSASPSGVGSLLERNYSFGGRANIMPQGQSQGVPASPLRNLSTPTKRGQAGSSSSGSSLNRARREGAFRRSAANQTRTGFFPSRGPLGGPSSASPASPAIAVESLATARGENSMLAQAGRSDSSLWRGDSETSSPRLSGLGSPKTSAGPSGTGGSVQAGSMVGSPTASPSGRLKRQRSSGAGSSDFSGGAEGNSSGGVLGLVGAARPSNASNLSVAGSSDVAFPRSRSHTGGGSIAGSSTIGRNQGGAASRKESFGSGFLSSLTFGRASARKSTQSRVDEADAMSATVTPSGMPSMPRRSTLEVMLGWPGAAATERTPSSISKGKRAVRGSVSEGTMLVEEAGSEEGVSGLEAGSPGSEAGSATAAEMLRRLARKA
ncbi:oligomeric, coiled-coil, peripheral membrane protein [Tilletia horrida]|uniref:Oligomeric, coiled-coil, peripheral membrane protein n=1 Tax=Tilletia horrida TaxID=155126 RepID=A0AAN6GTI0_9BASI|nr:oligomeric, coiled-coil, peripheral membrane protein [Tilletia horrida]KAK0567364.1 oligomeric, coiled-coil, peripheral membrane protein [Tilletia horrida]